MILKGLQKKSANVPRAQQLRFVQTNAERRLWLQLRNRQFHGLKFRRQAPVGPFIADFLCIDHKLIIELDGDIHELTKEYDREREKFLRRHGFTVIRFTNDKIFEDCDGVLHEILKYCAPHSVSLPRGESTQ